MGVPLVPLNDVAWLDAFADAGAREFYLGFHDPRWTQALGPRADLNRMSGFGQTANAFGLTEALEVVGAVRARGLSAYVTFNAAAYGADSWGLVEGYFWQLAEAGATGVILSGPELIDLAHRCGLAAVASTMCGVYNEDIARFYRDCGADRAILPRDLSVAEIARIAAAVPELQYEAFLMRNGCVYSDAYCLGVHGQPTGALCGELRHAARRVRTSLGAERVVENSDLHARDFHRRACGLCALWDLERAGVDAYKVVGRCDEGADIAGATALVARDLAIAARCPSREEYLRLLERPPGEGQVCDRRLNCYYPEVLD